MINGSFKTCSPTQDCNRAICTMCAVTQHKTHETKEVSRINWIYHHTSKVNVSANLLLSIKYIILFAYDNLTLSLAKRHIILYLPSGLIPPYHLPLYSQLHLTFTSSSPLSPLASRQSPASIILSSPLLTHTTPSFHPPLILLSPSPHPLLTISSPSSHRLLAFSALFTYPLIALSSFSPHASYSPLTLSSPSPQSLILSSPSPHSFLIVSWPSLCPLLTLSSPFP